MQEILCIQYIDSCILLFYFTTLIKCLKYFFNINNQGFVYDFFFKKSR